MTTYLWMNHEVVYEKDGRTVRVPRSEFILPSYAKAVPAQVLVVEAEIRQEDLLSSGEGVDRTPIPDLLPGDMVIQQEKIDRSVLQVMGIRIDLLREIYGAFPGRSIVSVVPYALAARAVLLASGNVNAGAVRVFLEDTGEGVLLGVFDGRKVLAVRELPPLPVDKVAVEMRRSSRGMDRSFSAEVFSNDPDLGVVAASVFGDGQKKPVILGIGLLSIRICRSARFGIHFMLPEEIIRHKKAAYFKREVLFFLMFGVLVVLASGLCFAAAMQRKERLSQETVVQRELVSARERLDIRRKQVCSDRIRRMPFVGSADVFEQLLSLIPSGYKVERVRWVAQEEGNGNVDAVIVEQGSSGLNEHWLPEGWKARRFISRGQPMTGLQFHLENGPVLFTQRRNK